MKYTLLLLVGLISISCFGQEAEKVETEGTITEITIHRGRKTRESAMVKFNLEDGKEQMGSVELFRIPFLGSMKSDGDKLTVNYDRNNPVLLETTQGKFLSTYGMYILIGLGIIFSLKPLLKYKKSQKNTT